MVDTQDIPQANKTRDWTLWIVLMVASVVLVGRGALISSAHSETWDDQYHIIRGERFLWMDKREILMNDPPLGEAIIAIPVTLSRVAVVGANEASRQVRDDAGLHEHPLTPDELLMLIAIWKSLLFLPCIGVMYLWARELYGRWAGGLAAAMGLVDPTMAAHVPIAALDTLGVTAIVLACWLAWKYAQSPAIGRLVALCAALAGALLIKHTALILPAVVPLIVIATRRRMDAKESGGGIRELRGAFQPVAAGALLVFLFVWAMTLFDLSKPRTFGRVFATEYSEEYSFKGDTLNGAMMNPWPAGIYLGSIAEALNHGKEGHRGFLFGEVRDTGWWYYFPVVAAYKVPIGIGCVIVLGAISLAWRKWRRDEWSVLIPMLAWALFLMSSTINIGFRHFLPAYVFMMIFASRAIAKERHWTQIACAAAMLATTAHAVAYHPNYLSYVNLPHDRAFLDVSDSNIDWGQSLKQVRRWLDENPLAGPVYLGYFGERTGSAIRHYLGNRVLELRPEDPAPDRGTLIISPVWLAGAGDAGERYAHLRDRPPDAVIGDCMLVYEFK